MPPDVVLTPIAGPLTGITAITHAGDGRIFLTLHRGQILVWDGATVLPTPFLDISSLIVCCGEQGLLSTAFHPNYAENGFFYVNYTNTVGDTVVARYSVSSDSNVADPFSGVPLLTIDQPFDNHNGGQLQFGPDGYLYIGMGDGGSANDPECFAQRMEPQPGRQDLLGKLLRIDVNQSVDTPPYYGIPADNPFVGSGGPNEAWAKGLRNPWRFSFDRLTGDLFIGDVGQGAHRGDRLSARGERRRRELRLEDDGRHPLHGQRRELSGGTPACDSPELDSADPRIRPRRRPLLGDRRLPVSRAPHPGALWTLRVRRLLLGRDLGSVSRRRCVVRRSFCRSRRAASRPSARISPASSTSATPTGSSIGSIPWLPATPVIDSVTPHQGYERGSDEVIITGSGFATDVQVLFGITPALAVTVVSPTELRVLSPPHARGVVNVSVENPGAPADVEVAAFVYVGMPRVTHAPGRDPRDHAQPGRLIRRVPTPQALRPQTRKAAAESAVRSTP